MANLFSHIVQNFHSKQFNVLRVIYLNDTNYFVVEDVVKAIYGHDVPNFLTKNVPACEIDFYENGTFHHASAVSEKELFELLSHCSLYTRTQYVQWLKSEVIPYLVRKSPIQATAAPVEKLLTVTEISKVFDTNGYLINYILIARGFQIRRENCSYVCYDLTEKGKLYGKKTTSTSFIYWKKSIIDILKPIIDFLNDRESEEKYLTPTDIGKLLGVDAFLVNRTLFSNGFQTIKSDSPYGKRYELTEKGKSYGKKTSASTSIYWKESIVDVLKPLIKTAITTAAAIETGHTHTDTDEIPLPF